FDERQNVAHSQDPLGHAVRIEGLEGVIFFAYTNEFYRLTSGLLNGKRRTPARVTVHLCQDHACNAYPPVNLICRANRILTCHRVSDEKNFYWMCLTLYTNQLVHQLIIDVQASGCIDQQCIKAG